ncbi:MAG: ATP-binding cassette domain-containing protein [Chloroflexi bacterium]|nr:ATP-binding cassette domain-containing protein [Chloroflexota bacterium]
MYAIEIQNLMKSFSSDVLAIDHLNLTIPEDRIYALLGPNGAGKTTTLSILTTLLLPTSGAAQVMGFDVVRQAAQVRENIGVTFQEIVLDPDLTGREVLDIHGRLYKMPTRQRQERIIEMVKLVELDEAIDRLVKTYSGGMKRRLELVRGLMTHPKVLFLDEPTQGLDPHNRAKIWDYIHELRRQTGLTIMLTTHYMEEAEALADGVGIIDHGKLVADSTPQALVTQLGADVVHIVGHGSPQPFLQALQQLPYIQEIHQSDDEGIHLQVGVDNGNRRLPEIIHLASRNGSQNGSQDEFMIDEISVARPSLGDVFLKLTGRALRDR